MMCLQTEGQTDVGLIPLFPEPSRTGDKTEIVTTYVKTLFSGMTNFPNIN